MAQTDKTNVFVGSSIVSLTSFFFHPDFFGDHPVVSKCQLEIVYPPRQASFHNMPVAFATARITPVDDYIPLGVEYQSG